MLYFKFKTKLIILYKCVNHIPPFPTKVRKSRTIYMNTLMMMVLALVFGSKFLNFNIGINATLLTVNHLVKSYPVLAYSQSSIICILT